MKLDYKKLHADIVKRLNGINKSQDHLAKKLKISRGTIHRLCHGKEVKIENLFKLIEWLEKDLENYIIYEKRKY